LLGGGVGVIGKQDGRLVMAEILDEELAVGALEESYLLLEDAWRAEFLDFLFSLNRINVAISRAQALSIVFASPHLLNVACNTVEDMRLANSLCALKAYGLPQNP
jgi:hypothetical protein